MRFLKSSLYKFKKCISGDGSELSLIDLINEIKSIKRMGVARQNIKIDDFCDPSIFFIGIHKKLVKKKRS